MQVTLSFDFLQSFCLEVSCFISLLVSRMSARPSVYKFTYYLLNLQQVSAEKATFALIIVHIALFAIL